jgi:hypothetical protein
MQDVRATGKMIHELNREGNPKTRRKTAALIFTYSGGEDPKQQYVSDVNGTSPVTHNPVRIRPFIASRRSGSAYQNGTGQVANAKLQLQKRKPALGEFASLG